MSTLSPFDPTDTISTGEIAHQLATASLVMPTQHSGPYSDIAVLRLREMVAQVIIVVTPEAHHVTVHAEGDTYVLSQLTAQVRANGKLLIAADTVEQTATCSPGEGSVQASGVTGGSIRLHGKPVPLSAETKHYITLVITVPLTVQLQTARTFSGAIGVRGKLESQPVIENPAATAIFHQP